MSSKEHSPEKPWRGFYGPNLGAVIELYDQYVEDPNSVDEQTRAHFEKWGPPALEENVSSSNAKETIGADMISAVVGAVRLADYIRAKGHLVSDIQPIWKTDKNSNLLDYDRFNVTEEELKKVPVKLICKDAPPHLKNGLEAIEHLKKVYTQTMAFEFGHVQDEEERNWLRKQVESEAYADELPNKEKKALLERLTSVEGFEKFIHRTFVGQKRFSIEGLDTLVPMLDKAIREVRKEKTDHVMIGMAHRGRLNVLAHTLGKPYKAIFSEFLQAPNKLNAPSEGLGETYTGWTGDVKYHLGADRQISDDKSAQTIVSLANNPSHLEFVSPIVEGYARAAQEDRSSKGAPKQDTTRAYSILIHGDAAFPGQGVVTETLNLSRLNGYHVGGSLHIIANNNIGYTTEMHDSRSTTYASDPAKGFEIPIVHVNADDAEACVRAIKFAVEYRRKFQKDFLIDLIGYRRFGHNEGDEPAVTQPDLYAQIRKHPTVRAIYAKQLEAEQVITAKEAQKLDTDMYNYLLEEYNKVNSDKSEKKYELSPPDFIVDGLPKVKTAVEKEKLVAMNEQLLDWPSSFKPNQKLEKILKRRANAFDGEGNVDWGLAEILAFASILHDGTPVRLSGQDSERGTFAHRHFVLHDRETNETHVPLQTIKAANASFAVYNSPLTEQACVGFEYGYNVFSKETLVLWEAQFGDFVNGAQVMFDQWVSAGRAKWGQKSGLVVLLPHGYEGAGPEHSSGRVERFLSSAAENNWTVANCTSAAQYFHILRRQAKILQKNTVRPLIIMTPKSLLRNQVVASPTSAFTEGEFQPILEEPTLGHDPNAVKRIILCSGKLAIELQDYVNKNDEDWSWVHIIRVEELYPFPRRAIRERLKEFPNLEEVKWVQEEPKNMGAWTFMEPRIREILPSGVPLSYIGRTYRSSPAEGVSNAHKVEQKRIVTESLTRKN
ncbi:2-oxoglutarate dehydrogenase E1 component [Shouchella clausii]|uniref:2-oxoglutarate dehydrogenase E1 component n=1 Tax=Shouchella clausii TaxID=79880 RepID=UPI001B1611DC|nr:2-oxoglutarate dehydrogenase E1 component [Shouchella clausii]MCM3312038.1 2-oxoglutarate dehydrogenase E1 component [Psychrobacillus sp. MER TA 17]GIN17696.1 2-oxoglutarate dehydrogenase E1 component [Shouchella clausii]